MCLPWVILYVQRWLAAPVQMPDGTLVRRDRGTPQGSAVAASGEAGPARRAHPGRHGPAHRPEPSPRYTPFSQGTARLRTSARISADYRLPVTGSIGLVMPGARRGARCCRNMERFN